MAESAAAARGNMVLMTMAASLVVREAERRLHLTIGIDEAMDIITVLLLGWHATVAAFVKYFPPPTPKP